jgi:uncharacterized protein YybS (DUF2232 family)
MDHNRNAKKLLEVIYLTIATVILAVIGFYIPVLMFLSAVPLAVLSVKTNEKVALLSAAGSYMFLIILTQQIVLATTILFAFGFAGIAIGHGLKRKWTFSEMFFISAGAYLFSLLTTILFLNYVEGVNQINQLITLRIKALEELITQIEANLHETGALLGDEQKYADFFSIGKAELVRIEYIIRLFIPSFFIISSAFSGYLALMSSKAILSRSGYDYKYFPAFSELRISRSAIVVFLLSFLLSSLATQQMIRGAFANIAFILSMVFMVCGLSILDFFVKKAGIPGVVRVIIYLIVFGIMMLLGIIVPFLHPVNILIILTLTDSIFNFRKLGHKGENHG